MPIARSPQPIDAGTSLIEAMLLILFGGLFLISAEGTLSTGVRRSVCRTIVALQTEGGGTDEATERERSGTERGETRRDRSRANSRVGIENCMSIAQGRRRRLGGGGLEGP